MIDCQTTGTVLLLLLHTAAIKCHWQAAGTVLLLPLFTSQTTGTVLLLLLCTSQTAGTVLLFLVCSSVVCKFDTNQSDFVSCAFWYIVLIYLYLFELAYWAGFGEGTSTAASTRERQEPQPGATIARVSWRKHETSSVTARRRWHHLTIQNLRHSQFFAFRSEAAEQEGEWESSAHCSAVLSC